MNVRGLVLGLALVCATAACDEVTETPIDPSVTAPVVHESFSGSVSLLGSAFYSFTQVRTGRVKVTLLTLVENGAASTTTVGVGVGVPRGTDCIVQNAVNTATGGAPQLTIDLDPSIYCVRVFDTGTLTAPATFSVNITRPQ
jgi:hypothetical protein